MAGLNRKKKKKKHKETATEGDGKKQLKKGREWRRQSIWMARLN